MELSQVLRERRSVRRFKDMPVSPDVIQDILEGASLAPETDTCNYYLGVVTDKDTKNALAQATLWADWIAGAPAIFAVCCDITWDIAGQADDSYGVTGNRLRYNREIIEFLRQHPDRKACKKLLCASPNYIVAQHIVLGAVSHGLRGCIVDFMDTERMNTVLGLPEHVSCQVLVPVGVADETPREKEAVNFDTRVFYDHWQGR